MKEYFNKQREGTWPEQYKVVYPPRRPINAERVAAKVAAYPDAKRAINMDKFTLRTAHNEARYQADKKAGRTIPLHKEPMLQRFTHWFLIDNRYPYDAAFSTHHMLLPYSRVSHRNELSLKELTELKEILTYYVEPNYDLIMDNTNKRRSVTNHYHLHLCSYKEER